MATKTPQPTPNEPDRPAASRTKAAAKADAVKPKAKHKPKPKPATAAKPKADSAAKPKPAKTTAAGPDASKTRKQPAAKTAHAKPAAGKERPHSSQASRMASRKTSTRPTTKTASAEGRKKSAGPPAAQTDASAHENHVVKTLFDSLEAHVAANDLGHVVGPKQFDLGSSEPTGRLPDIAFVSFDRWAQYRRVPTHDRWHVPDLLVQVVRKGELAEDFTVQLDECFSAGVRRVWLLFPDKGEARVYESAADVHTLEDSQSIDGGDVLPGFEHSLVLLFREPQDPS